MGDAASWAAASPSLAAGRTAALQLLSAEALSAVELVLTGCSPLTAAALLPRTLPAAPSAAAVEAAAAVGSQFPAHRVNQSTASQSAGTSSHSLQGLASGAEVGMGDVAAARAYLEWAVELCAGLPDLYALLTRLTAAPSSAPGRPSTPAAEADGASDGAPPAAPSIAVRPSPHELLTSPPARLRGFAKALLRQPRHTAVAVGLAAARHLLPHSGVQHDPALAGLAAAYAVSAGVRDWPYGRAALVTGAPRSVRELAMRRVEAALQAGQPVEAVVSGVRVYTRRAAHAATVRCLYAFSLCWTHTAPGSLPAAASEPTTAAAALGSTIPLPVAGAPAAGTAPPQLQPVVHSPCHEPTLLPPGTLLDPASPRSSPAPAPELETPSLAPSPPSLPTPPLLPPQPLPLRQYEALQPRVHNQHARAASHAGRGSSGGGGDGADEESSDARRPPSRAPIPLAHPTAHLIGRSLAGGGAPGAVGAGAGAGFRTLAAELQDAMASRHPGESALTDAVRLAQATPATALEFVPPAVFAVCEARGSGVEQLLLRAGLLMPSADAASVGGGRDNVAVGASPASTLPSHGSPATSAGADLTSARGLLSALARAHVMGAGGAGGPGPSWASATPWTRDRKSVV